MTIAAALRHYLQLEPQRRALLAEAMTTLALASIAIKLMPFRRVVQVVGSTPRAALPDAQRNLRLIEQCRWAVETAANRVPWKAVCFQRGLALHLMLRRRDVRSVLYYGAAQTSERGLVAHVWISAGDEIVLGGDEAADFACLASFPSEPAS